MDKVQVEESLEVLTLAQAAQLLQVAPQTVRNELMAGRLPGCKVGKAWRLSRVALADHLAGRAATSGGPAA